MHRLPRPFLVAAAADVTLAALGRQGLRWVTKPLLMPTLMPGRDRRTQVALALGAAGDTALLGRGDPAFRAGLASFLAGHLAWLAALRARPGRRLLSRRPGLALPYLVTLAGSTAYFWPRTGPDRLPVAAYGCALTATALAALDSGDPATATGGVLFLASDTLLALERYAGVALPGHEAWVMATYLAAQALLADGGTPSR